MPFIPNVHIVYTVRPGDTLFSLAQRFQSDVMAIRSINAVYPPFTDVDVIFPGQTLLVPVQIPAVTQVLYMVQPRDTLYRIAQQYGVAIDMLVGLTPDVQQADFIFPEQLIQVPAFIYEVQPGDSLNRIASMTGIPLVEILRANTGRAFFSPDVIFPGYRIIIPAKASRNIYVDQPYPGQRVQSGFRLSGYARAFEANVNFHVRDALGGIVTAERFVTAAYGAPAYAPFQTQVPFDVSPATEAGELWVYTRSAKDGSIQDLVRVQIYFS